MGRSMPHLAHHPIVEVADAFAEPRHAENVAYAQIVVRHMGKTEDFFVDPGEVFDK